MARTVREIMNRELLSVREGAPADETLEMILEFGVTAVPVLDADKRPVGVRSLRDLVRSGPAAQRMTTPATTIDVGASIHAAAETMARTGRHHLVVVGGDGRSVGMVSSLDVVRALIGHPTTHPAAFPGFDSSLDVFWSGEGPFEEGCVGTIPHGPGVLVLVNGGLGREDLPVWVDATADLRVRADDLLRDAVSPGLPQSRGSLWRRVRWCVVSDDKARATLARRIRERIEATPPPRAP